MKTLFRLTLLLVCSWILGFAYYIYAIRALMPSDAPCDGLIVLTGSLGRIEEGFRQLEAGRAPRMLISGVGDDRHSENVLRDYVPSSALRRTWLRDGVVELDRKADSTYGNAEQSREWLDRFGIQRACLITSNYHMPRSLIVFREAMPEREFVPIPIEAPKAEVARMFEEEYIFRLIHMEYAKMLAAWLIAQARPLLP